MLFVLVVASLIAVGLASLASPWVGVIAGFLVTVLAPQTIWFWAFEGLRPVMWVLVPTVVGFFVAILRGSVSLRPAVNYRMGMLLVFFLGITLSYFFGPYSDLVSPWRFIDPARQFDVIWKTVLLCLLACICIDSERRLRVLVWVLIGTVLYMIYWANAQYFFYGYGGRLPGPRGPDGPGIYTDENAFAILFVVGQPFLWHSAKVTKRAWIRAALLLAIPWAWHSVFLTGSRGGLLGLGAVTILMALRERNRVLGFLLVPMLVAAFVWQAGDVMKERFSTIDDYEEEASASSRLEAWQAARGMIAAYPILGVGLSSFGAAFPDFLPTRPREAHNTYFQISAESGLLTGAAYLGLLLGTIVAMQRLRGRLRRAGAHADASFLISTAEATLVALVGFAVVALFLSLQSYGVFYLLIAIANSAVWCSRGLISGQRLAATEGPRTTCGPMALPSRR